LRPASFGFGQLRIRLAVLYAGLFAVAMLCVAILLFAVVQRVAEAQVRNELVANGTVFDRLWQQRADQLRSAAGLLARDFGFRAAVATHDRRTVESALTNLEDRLGLPLAFIVDTDGTVTGVDAPAIRKAASALASQLDAGITAGALALGGEPREIVAAPIMAPALSGWVVFSNNLDAHEMRALERLAAIPLSAAVYQRQPDGRWLGTDRSAPADAALDAFIEANVKAGAPAELAGPDGTAIALAKPLPTIPGAPPTALLLQYPLSLALAAYRPLEIAIVVIAICGLALVMAATFRMARSITRPISLLDAAADRLAQGDVASVPVEGHDELGRLAVTFNRMSADIVERERRITHLAFNDVLTNLPNRALFHEHLEQELRQMEHRRIAGIALFCIDLDDFKSINDTLGHPTGDELLRDIAQRLTSEMGGLFVARLGGDEFVLVKPFVDDGAVDDRAGQILTAIRQPMRIGDHEVLPAASIGIAIAPADGHDAETLLRNANLALYRAKAAGRNTWRFFEESMNARAQHRRSIEVDLRQALRNGELELHYQPQLDLAQGRIGAFEALIRWHHPTRGMIPPTEFIPIAEESGLIVPIGAWVIQEACRRAATWPDPIRIAVNVSSIQFGQPGLAQAVMLALQGSGLRPDRLEIEITESIFLASSDATVTLLHSLRNLGVRIALDDFGTGYSSLSYLQSFPFNKIKIDRSFVIGLDRPGGRAIVQAIIDLARALGMETTAEGVEEEGQISVLKAQGCTYMQGYLLSRPLPAAGAARLLEQRRKGEAA
jgi:diguanylate cyclase (GGDEF)-like protein